jgi:hypothetical protein
MNERILKDFKSTRLLHIRRREKIGEQIIQGKNNGKEDFVNMMSAFYLVKCRHLKKRIFKTINTRLCISVDNVNIRRHGCSFTHSGCQANSRFCKLDSTLVDFSFCQPSAHFVPVKATNPIRLFELGFVV